MMKKLNILIVAAFLTACTEEIAVSNVERDKLTFSVEMDDEAELTRAIIAENDREPLKIETARGPLYIHRIVERRAASNATRGALVDELSGTAGFGVSGYRYTPPTETVSSVNANFFYNAKVTKDVNGKWVADESYYWPSDADRLDFCAYYPYVTTTGTTNITDIAGNGTADMGPMKISYTVDEDISNQTDLMTAYTPNQKFSKNAEVPLTFRHALTAINFQLDDDVAPGYIKRIILSDIYTSGTVTVGSTNSWSYNTAGTFTIEFADASNNGGFSTTQTNRQMTTTPVLMIPQSHAKHGDFEPSMTVVINDSETGNDADYLHPLKVTLDRVGDRKWVAGTQVTYLITTSSINVLRMGTITYPTDWGGDTFSVKTAYEEGDTVGVYAVNADGKVIKANKPYRYNGTSWIATDTSDTLRYSSTTNYYLYYPYRKDLKGGRTLGSSFNNNPASENVEDAFFADVISNWAVNADQSTRDKLLACDLQIAKATKGDVATKVNATMKHALDLGVITLGAKHIDNSVTYKIDDTYQWPHDEVIASDNFTGNLLYEKDGLYYFVFKPVTNDSESGTLLKGLDDNNNEDWSTYLKTTAYSTCINTTVYTNKTSFATPTVKPYVLEIGDIYYRNGAISHELISTANNSCYGTPAGIVFSTSTSNVDNNAGYKHGYVVAAKAAGSGLAWTTSANHNTPRITNISWTGNNMDASLAIIKNLELDGNNGRWNTTNFMNAMTLYNNFSTFPAFNAIKTFNSGAYAVAAATATQTRTTWYMPSIAEWWLMCDNLAQLSANESLSYNTAWPGGSDPIYGAYYVASSADNVREKINTYLEKTGTGNYTYFTGGQLKGKGNSPSTDARYWSSSEWTGTGQAFDVGFNTIGQLVFRYCGDKSNNTTSHIRTILAF